MDTFEVIEPTHFLPSLAITFEGTLIEPPSEPLFPRRRHSPSSPRPNLRSPAVVFSITDSPGEGSIENHEDPHLGNGAVDHTLAVRVFWRRRVDVAAATTTVEPPPSFLAAPSWPSFLAASSSGPVTPSHPLFNFNRRSPLKAQGIVISEFDAAQRVVPASLLHHRHRFMLGFF
ncbi:hypothetical protein PIB30_057305 [Stylosanthes scabra]|uniref:Uncharacterized protein n=1 Tax=Stylosanthes scabra TaxID=79078 RepID=A0ABU6XIN6_9FABA|nr:hypothetical protein [Stylosanthes scabra]